MVRIDAFGMPSEELIARIEAEAGVGNREIVVTTDSKDTLEDLVAYSNKSDSSIDINVVENDKGWEVRLEIVARIKSRCPILTSLLFLKMRYLRASSTVYRRNS